MNRLYSNILGKLLTFNFCILSEKCTTLRLLRVLNGSSGYSLYVYSPGDVVQLYLTKHNG